MKNIRLLPNIEKEDIKRSICVLDHCDLIVSVNRTPSNVIDDYAIKLNRFRKDFRRNRRLDKINNIFNER